MLNHEKVKILFFVIIACISACAGDARQDVVLWSRQHRIEKGNKLNIRAVLFKNKTIKLVELIESWDGNRTCRSRSVGYADCQDGAKISMENACVNASAADKIFDFINVDKIRLTPNSDIVLNDDGIVFSIQSRTSELWIRGNATDFPALYRLLDAAAN